MSLLNGKCFQLVQFMVRQAYHERVKDLWDATLGGVIGRNIIIPMDRGFAYPYIETV